MFGIGLPLLVIIIILALYLLNCIKILREYERAVVFSLGRLSPPDRGPGLIFIFAPIQKMVRVDLPGRALRLVGYPVSEEIADRRVIADVLLTQDGTPYALRLIQNLRVKEQ